MAGTSSPEFDMLRRQFTTTLQNAASAFRAAGMVVEQYGKIIEHGGIPTAHEITQIALQLPVIAAGGLAPPVQTGKGRKGRGGDVEMILVDPSHEGDTKKRKRGPKKEKDPNAPKRPPSAYLLYQNDVRQQVKEAYPEKSYNELITEISKMWGELTPEEKKPYFDANEVAKGRYEREKAAYDAAHPAAGPAGLVGAGLPAETPAAEADASSSEDAPSPVVIKAPTPPPKASKAKAAKEAKEAKEKEAKEAKEVKTPKSSNAKPRKSRAAPEPAPPPALDSGDEDGMADADAEAAEVEPDEEEDARPTKRAKKDRSSSGSPKKDKKEKGSKSRK